MTSATLILHRSAWLAWALLAASALSFGYMVFDSRPPFELRGYTVSKSHAGELLRVDASVKRDLARGCSVAFSRHIFDSVGTRWDVQGQTNMPATALSQLDQQAPGKLRLAVPLPLGIAPGPARLVTPLEYKCNPWHAVQPIVVVMTIEFEVVP